MLSLGTGVQIVLKFQACRHSQWLDSLRGIRCGNNRNGRKRAVAMAWLRRQAHNASSECALAGSFGSNLDFDLLWGLEAN
jgi:hypothetical protein